MNKIKILISVISTVFPSKIRISILNLLGYKVSPKAKLKLFSVIISQEINIGAFAKIDSFAIIVGLENLIMQEYSAIQRFSYISGNHRFKIGKQAMIGSRCVISTSAGDVEIGQYSALAPRSSIHTHGTYLPVTLGYSNKNNGVKIGDFCWIMHSTSISPGITIESNSIVLPGSIISKNVPDNSVVFDTPVQRKTFPLYFFKKKLDETELINLIKEITIHYLNELKHRKVKIDYSVDGEVINIIYNKSKHYKILFSDFNAEELVNDNTATQIYFYFNLNLEVMKKRLYIAFDFNRIIKSYLKLPEIFRDFDEFVFFHYGLKFIDIKYH